MGYNRQNFYDGQTLHAAHLKKMEDGIISVEKEKVSQTDYNKKLIKIDEDIENSKMVWRGKGALPIDTEHVLAMDYEEEILYYKDENQLWQKIAQVGGGYSKITFVEDYSVEYGEELKNIVISGLEENYIVSFGWSSVANGELIEDDGVYSVYVDGIKKESQKCPYTRYRYEDDDTEKENPIPINPIKIDIRKYLKAGTNKIKVEIQDGYKNTNYFEFNIIVVDITLTIPSGGYTQNTISYYKVGNTEVSKQSISLRATTSIDTVIYLDWIKEDGEIENLDSKRISSTTNLDLSVPKLPHGNHLIKIYACGYQNDDIIARSNELYFDVIWVDNITNDTNSILASSFSIKEIDQYQFFKIPYFLYAPNKIESYVRFKIAEKDKEAEATYTTPDLKSTQTALVWEVSYSEQLEYVNGIKQPKEVNFIIEMGRMEGEVFIIEDSKIFPITILPVEEPNLPIYTGENLVFKFVADSVENTPEARSEWKMKYKTSNEVISAAMDDTAGNLVGVDGNISKWQMHNNRPALKLSNGSRFNLPLPILEQRSSIANPTGLPNFTNSGMTLEMDLSFDNITDYDSPFFICGTETDGVFKGIKVTPNRALLSCGNVSTETKYETSESKNFSKSMRISFVIQPLETLRNEEYNLNRTIGGMYIYINGIGTSAIDYSSGEDFQSDAMPYFIGKGCDVYLHSVSFYKQRLTQTDILNTWVMDMQMGDAVNAAKKNDIYNDNDRVTVDFGKCNTKLPCMIITGALPGSKGDKKAVSIDFYCLEDEKNTYSFSLPGAQIDVQGTSSQYYPVKNWKFKPNKNSDDPYFYIGPPGQADRPSKGSYSLGPDQIEEKTFCLKADYMETASCHNTVTANIANYMYNKTKEGKTPPQNKNELIRTTIYGRPILVFYRDTETSDLRFGGKYNFNYDKDAEKVFGFEEKYATNDEMLECVEFCQNRETRCLLQKSDYTEVVPNLDEAGLNEFDEKSHITNADGTVTSAYKWGNCFEFRYFYHGENAAPSPIAYLKEVTDWIVAVDITKANNEESLETEYRTKKGVVNYEYDKNMQIITFKDDLSRTRKSLDITEEEIYKLGYKIETYYQTNYYELIYDENGDLIKKEFKYSNIEKVVDKTSFVPPEESESVQGRYYYALYYDENEGEIFIFDRNTEVYRLTKFKTELSEHFNEHYCLMYFLLMELLGMIDSSTKNMFWASWGERHPDHPYGKDNVVIWYPIFYDMDTQQGINNVGKMNIPYNIEFDSVLYSYVDDNGNTQTVYAYNGHDNAFWNLFRRAYETELSDLFRTKVSDGTFSLNSLLKQYKEHTLNFPEAIYNEDGALKILDFFFSGDVYLGETDEEGNVEPKFPDWLYVYQGDRYYYRNYWLPNRFYYLLSKYRSGSYVSDYISMRLNNPYMSSAVPSDELKPNYDFDIITWKDQYTRIKYGGQSVVKRCEADKSQTFSAPLDSYNDTEAAIFGASNIKEISSFSHKYLNSLDLSAATKLLKVDIGSDIDKYSNSTLDNVSFGSNRLLASIGLRNCRGLKKTLDVSSCSNLKYLDARGTQIPSVTLPSAGILEEVYLPDTINTLKISNQTNLKVFDLPTNQSGNYSLINLSVSNTPLIDTKTLVEKSIDAGLKTLEIYDANWTMPNGELLKKIKTKAEKGDLTNLSLGKAILQGKFYVDQMDSYSIKKIKHYFSGVPEDKINDDAALDNQEGRSFQLYVTRATRSFQMKFLNDGEEIETDLLDNRIDDGASYMLPIDKLPNRQSEWDRNWIFDCWKVTYTENDVEISDFKTNSELNNFPIKFDIILEAVYVDKPKIFTFIFEDNPGPSYVGSPYQNYINETTRPKEINKISLMAYESNNLLEYKDLYQTEECDVKSLTKILPTSGKTPSINDFLIADLQLSLRFNTWIKADDVNNKISEETSFIVSDLISNKLQENPNKDEYIFNYKVEPVESSKNYYITFKNYNGDILVSDAIYFYGSEIDIPESIKKEYQNPEKRFYLKGIKSDAKNISAKRQEFSYENGKFEKVLVSEAFAPNVYYITFEPIYREEDRYYNINFFTTTDKPTGAGSEKTYEETSSSTYNKENLKYKDNFTLPGITNASKNYNGDILNGHTATGNWNIEISNGKKHSFVFNSSTDNLNETIESIFSSNIEKLGGAYGDLTDITTINFFPEFKRNNYTISFYYYNNYDEYSQSIKNIFDTTTLEEINKHTKSNLYPSSNCPNRVTYSYGDKLNVNNNYLFAKDKVFQTIDKVNVKQNINYPWRYKTSNDDGTTSFTSVTGGYVITNNISLYGYYTTSDPNREYWISFTNGVEVTGKWYRYGDSVSLPGWYSIDYEGTTTDGTPYVVVDRDSWSTVTGAANYVARSRYLRTATLTWGDFNVGSDWQHDDGYTFTSNTRFTLFTSGTRDYSLRKFIYNGSTLNGFECQAFHKVTARYKIVSSSNGKKDNKAIIGGVTLSSGYTFTSKTHGNISSETGEFSFSCDRFEESGIYKSKNWFNDKNFYFGLHDGGATNIGNIFHIEFKDVKFDIVYRSNYV